MRWHNFLFVWLLGYVAIAQQFPSTNYTDRDILPNNTVRTLFMAADGALWIGTNNGLVRKYNNQITTFYKEDGLTQNNIWALAQDDTGRIWIGSYGKGLTSYYNNQLVAYPNNDKLPNQEITELFIDKNILYAGTSDGVAVIDLKEPKNINSIKPKSIKDEKFIVSGFIAMEDVFAVTYTNGIYRIERTQNDLHLKMISAEKNLYATQTFKDSIYLSGKQFFKKIPTSQLENLDEHKELNPLGNSIIWDYQKVNNQMYGAAWGIYTNDGGLYELTGTGMKLRNEDFGIESTQVTSLAFDKDLGLLYAGTLDKGLFAIKMDEKLQFLPSNHKKIQGFSRINEMTATLYNDGLQIGQTLITASDFKTWQVEYVNKYKNNLPQYEDHFYELEYDTNARDIAFYSVKDRAGHFWVNTSIGIYQFDTTGTLKNYLPVHALEFSFTASDQLLETNFFHGTRIYESVDPIEYTYYDQQETQQNPRYVVGCLQVGAKTYMTSIFYGLYAYEEGKFTSYKESDLWKENRLRFITKYNRDQIAVSNEDGDVFILNDDKKNFTAAKLERNTDYGSTITFLNSYKDFVIIGTPKGIVLHNGKREIFLDREQGIDEKIYTGFMDGNLLMLGSDNGSYKLKLADIIDQNNRLTGIAVSSIIVNGISRDWKTSDKLKLASDENSLELQLTTNKHPYPGKLKYSYRLDPSQEWTPLEDAVLSLPFLESGKYNLFVRVKDASTGMTLDKQILDFSIAIPFYKSLWFIVLCFCISFGLIAFYIHIKWKRAKKRALEKEAAIKRNEEVKMEALLSQMNPHFVFNSLNSVQYLISNNENEKAMRYLRTFSDLMRANLNNTTRPYLTLEEEIDYLKKYSALENARFSDRIDVTFTIDPELSLSQTSIPTMMLQPFVENAFVHAFPSRIESPRLNIAFAKITNEEPDRKHDQTKIIDHFYYRCTVTDNGIGNASQKNKRHISKGTQLVRERLSFLGYNPTTALEITHTAVGTIVTLELEQEHLS
ncbi:sensor histidine kinase [Nonlabens antarcticus]|uniref:sensor histidine kinase n=1 Tax=Nonlabens antarcticus TaxID=392714 RepID=UPI001891DD54|nr:histidine kinase [Nonlabens antarcticus]